MTDTITVRHLGAREAQACVEALAEVLLDCVEGGASVSFMWPLPRERALLVAEDAAGRIVGTVQLIMSMPDNQPHRADVARMLVHRRTRRIGIARRLMAALDEVAWDEGKTVLVLDTVTGGDAERLYERAGWQRAGVVPKYALMPGGKFCATSFFYKHLQDGSATACSG